MTRHYGTNRYKHVSRFAGGWLASMKIHGLTWMRTCPTEHAAAVAVDIKLLELEREPINVLKRIL